MGITNDTKRETEKWGGGALTRNGAGHQYRRKGGQTTPRLFDKPQGILLSYTYLKLYILLTYIYVHAYIDRIA